METDLTSLRVFYSSRRRSIGLLGISLLFLVIGVLMLGEDWGWAVLAFGLVCTAVSAFMLLRPNRLELSAQGLSTVTLGRRWSAEWSQCRDFRTWKDDTNLGSPRMVIFDCSAPGVRGHLLESLATGLTGANAALPETYGLDPEELASLLNAYREANSRAR